MPKKKKTGRVHCAECENCKLVREQNSGGRYVLKARCSKNHWLRGRKETFVEYHNVGRRTRKACPDYISTSDDDDARREYLDGLEDLLPIERHIFESDGSFVDKTETMEW